MAAIGRELDRHWFDIIGRALERRPQKPGLDVRESLLPAAPEINGVGYSGIPSHPGAAQIALFIVFAVVIVLSISLIWFVRVVDKYAIHHPNQRPGLVYEQVEATVPAQHTRVMPIPVPRLTSPGSIGPSASDTRLSDYLPPYTKGWHSGEVTVGDVVASGHYCQGSLATANTTVAAMDADEVNILPQGLPSYQDSVLASMEEERVREPCNCR
ncbi:uncharacterized protein SPPG_06281 [Spizellomyces punctatus DAOM BR117]|uniref:Uncharacterized protein n=1 Tax=Spizellomyces punctatus (strain DAOM BR117) TaxID=645134 RepID=A0A0L0HBP3_SPIPD|nr:uncharacterized protein SPPG_06281 [Spizellomyces punctatus DAOM BR117]KNC98597.1 hypothetical protein SPPG_06281 [Spizellomyces punctatus DAOM BR117]|eukprot:XP_016606637.1 hypothetical protein SPPG_06281 [Spizellomyces punctatus DAOM BR117]